MAVLPGEGVLRARPAAAVVELQLRAGGEEHRLRRAKEPGEGGAGPGGGVQDGALVLDEQRAPGLATGFRRDDQSHQRRGVQRRELGRGGRSGGLLQGLLQAVRRRPREQPQMLGDSDLLSRTCSCIMRIMLNVCIMHASY